MAGCGAFGARDSWRTFRRPSDWAHLQRDPPDDCQTGSDCVILASIDHLLLLGQVAVPIKDRRALNLMEHGAFRQDTALVEAESVGRFFNAQVKGNFDCRLILCRAIEAHALSCNSQSGPYGIFDRSFPEYSPACRQ